MGVLNHWSECRKIKELADLFVSKRTFLVGNWAMQRAKHGEQPDWALIVLASMIGQVGLSGGALAFLCIMEETLKQAQGQELFR
ncbi:hypothetical protein JP0054_12850 [Helicobacter pylori]|nr:hypothetical protein JP0054_12850 [Helicobacter pylori]